MLKVAKFGGSSVAGAEQFRKVKSIIEADPARRVVVVSAAGKRSADDHKLTDLLYLCHAHLSYGVSCDDILQTIEGRFAEIRTELGLRFDAEGEMKKLAAGLSRDTSVDELVSRGEYYTARLMAEYLGYRFVDAADCVFFGYDGQIDRDRTDRAIAEALAAHGRILIPGFYGRLPTGKIKVMSRGGSDITGALAAAATDADVYENWTDVSGILMADPRIVPDPRPIAKVTYAELRELAFMGASVMHEDSIQPVKDKGIALNIRNTNRPDDPGTLIVGEADDRDESERFITGIAGRRNFTIITVQKRDMNANATLCQALEIMDRYHAPVEHITLGLDSFALVSGSAAMGDALYDVLADIRKTCRPDNVRVLGPPLQGARRRGREHPHDRAGRRRAGHHGRRGKQGFRDGHPRFVRRLRRIRKGEFMMKELKIGVLGATGAVGQEMLKILEEYDIPVSELRPLASARSAGSLIKFKGKDVAIQAATDESFEGLDFVLGAVEGDMSRRFAPAIKKSGAVYIDNSSAFRLEPDVPLVVPEINGADAFENKGLIANPNCCTIIALMAVAGIAKLSEIESMVVCTYQAVSGAGQAGIAELDAQMAALAKGEKPVVKTFAAQIAMNVIPFIDAPYGNDYTKEEMKMQNEGRRILHCPDLKVNCTCVRVPVMRSHSIAVTLRTKEKVSVEAAKAAVAAYPGVRLIEDYEGRCYPTPLDTTDQDLVWVGRIREDLTDEKGLTLWCCGDQIRKGAASNAVQILKLLAEGK